MAQQMVDRKTDIFRGTGRWVEAHAVISLSMSKAWNLGHGYLGSSSQWMACAASRDCSLYILDCCLLPPLVLIYPYTHLVHAIPSTQRSLHVVSGTERGRT